jgi:acetyltransferase-like isoleucine patch superfamily enzyme
MLGFLKYRCFQRPSCHECAFKENKRAADVTLADYWGLTWKYPEKAGSQEHGVSVIITHTKKGQKIFDHYVKKNMYFEKHSIADIEKGNSSMNHPQTPGLYRDFFFENLNKNIPFSTIMTLIDNHETALQREREAERKKKQEKEQKGGIFGKLTKIGNTVITMHPTARINIADGAELICNMKLQGSKNKECVLYLEENATLNVNGRFAIGCDSVLQVIKGGTLTLNSGSINVGALIAIQHNTVIGNGFLCGRSFVLHDSDFHQIFDKTSGQVLNAAKQGITIGEHVWCGEGVTILKEVTIGEHSVIGARAVVTKDIPPHVVAVGIPAKVVKENMDWKG